LDLIIGIMWMDICALHIAMSGDKYLFMLEAFTTFWIGLLVMIYINFTNARYIQIVGIFGLLIDMAQVFAYDPGLYISRLFQCQDISLLVGCNSG
jgi:hypothetical protein